MLFLNESFATNSSLDSWTECNPLPLVRHQGLGRILTVYVFPLFICLGIPGNILNLIVLNRLSMQRGTNVFLSCMAVCDMLFLLSRFPNFLAALDIFDRSQVYRHFYYAIKLPVTSFGANWLSAASIWFSLVVMIERTSAVRSPLSVRVIRRKTFAIVILFVLVLTFGATAHYLVWGEMVPAGESGGRIISCKPTLLYSLSTVPKRNTTPVFKSFINGGLAMGAIFVVVGPLIMMIALNTNLICVMRRQSAERGFLRTNTGRALELQERKITMMVCCIIGSYIVLNLPSTYFHMIHYYILLFKEDAEVINRVYSPEGVRIANTLVEVGKTINFWLYCISSEHFRKKVHETLFHVWRPSALPIMHTSASTHGRVDCTLTGQNGNGSPATTYYHGQMELTPLFPKHGLFISPNGFKDDDENSTQTTRNAGEELEMATSL